MTVCAGYPQLLSGDLSVSNLPKLVEDKQKILFPETAADRFYADATKVKRYYLSLPFYPFRTLGPRDLQNYTGLVSHRHSFDYNPISPLFPANTQLDIVLKMRKDRNFLPYMLPYQLDQSYGSSQSRLTVDQQKNALKFTTVTKTPAQGDAPATETTNTFIITKVEIDIKDIYLQV